MENNEIAIDEWSGVDFFDMAKPAQSVEERISTLEKRSNWHRSIGWKVASLLGAALVALVTWWMPHELDSLRNSIKADNASQLEPIKIEMARINALLQLKETKSVSEAIRLGVDFSEPKYALGAVKAIMQQAKAENIQTEPSVLIKANDQIKDSAKGYPDLLNSAWSARLSLVDYRTSLPLEQATKGNPEPPLTWRGTMYVDFHLSSSGITIQQLDGVYWKNGTFENIEIDYDGGPMILENVKFINCRFKMKYNIRSDKFDDMLLAQNPITGSFS